MKKFLALVLLLIGSAAWAESYLYLSQQKEINGAYKYYLPKLEWNQNRWAGKFFGNKCWYLSRFEGGLVYTAPRISAFSLNHHSIEAEWALGIEVGPFLATYSIGAVGYLEGNNEGIPAGIDGYNQAKLGLVIN